MSDAHARTSRPATRRRIACILRRRSHTGISTARSIAAVNPLIVVRIDDQGLRELLRGAGQLAQNQHAVVIVARGDEFLRDQIHPVVQRRDDAETRQPIQSHELRQRKRPLQVANRPLLRSLAVRPVHARDLFLDLG